MDDTSEQSLSSQLAGSNIASLYTIIDKDNVYGLNLETPEQARDVIKSWAEREDISKFVDSGVDDQVIIHVPFIQNVRVKSILLKLGRGEFTPRRLRIYANYSSIVDFSDAEIAVPELDISLLEDRVEVTEYPLRVAAFASVTSLSLFFSEAAGEEKTRIYFVGFYGDVSNPKKDIRTKIDIPASHAAESPLVDTLTQKSSTHHTVR